MAFPSTWFAKSTGPDGDRPGPDRFLVRMGAYTAAFVLSPIFVLTHLTWYVVFQWGRGRWWAPLPVAATLTGIAALWPGSIPGLALHYAHTYLTFVQGVVAGQWEGGLLLDWLRAQLLLGVAAGSWTAGVATAWKWVRRPKWEIRHITPGPLLRRRHRTSMRELATGQVSLHGDAIPLGVSEDTHDHRYAGDKPGAAYGRIVTLTQSERQSHTLATGAPGAGKTTTLLQQTEQVIAAGQGVVWIDPKASPAVTQRLRDLADHYGRPFQHFTLQQRDTAYPGPASYVSHYNPIGRGDSSRRKDLIIGAIKWDAEYYKATAGDWLQTALEVMRLTPPGPGDQAGGDLDTLVRLIDPAAMMQRAQHLPRTPDTAALWANLDAIANWKSSNLNDLSALRASLNTLRASTAGWLLTTHPDPAHNIDLERAARDGTIVCFSLDTSNYEETSKLLAGLIVQDLKTVASGLLTDPIDTPLNIYLDEAGSVEAANLRGLIDKSREARMPVTLAVQTLAQLARTADGFDEEILGLIGVFLLHRANSEAEARVMAGLSGVIDRAKTRRAIVGSSTHGALMGAAAATGDAYLETEEATRVPPGAFQDLAPGQLVAVVKAGRDNRPWVVAPCAVIPTVTSPMPTREQRTIERQPEPQPEPPLEQPTPPAVDPRPAPAATNPEPAATVPVTPETPTSTNAPTSRGTWARPRSYRPTTTAPPESGAPVPHIR